MLLFCLRDFGQEWLDRLVEYVHLVLEVGLQERIYLLKVCLRHNGLGSQKFRDVGKYLEEHSEPSIVLVKLRDVAHGAHHKLVRFYEGLDFSLKLRH